MPTKGETKPVLALAEGRYKSPPLLQPNAIFYSFSADFILDFKGKEDSCSPSVCQLILSLPHSWSSLAISTTFNHGAMCEIKMTITEVVFF